MGNPFDGAITLIGGGSWGTALSVLLAGKGLRVRLWVHDPRLARKMAAERENTVYLPGVTLPPQITICSALSPALADSRIALFVVPSRHLRDVAQQAGGVIPPECRVLSASKGMEVGTHRRMSQVLEEELGDRRPLAVLSGPSFAKEVARGFPAAVVVAAGEPEAAQGLQQMLSTPCFRVYTSNDVVGVELGGALKNVIALATGISDGLGFGQNARSALITRGLAEISRLGAFLGANPLTFLGLAGVGDLVLTCTGDLSRNRQVGLQLSRGYKLTEIISGMQMIAEGVTTVKAVLALAQQSNVELPICTKVYQVLYEDKDPRQAVNELMGRTLKEEF